MGVRPLTASQTVDEAQAIDRITGPSAGIKTPQPQGGAEEGQQKIDRVIGGV